MNMTLDIGAMMHALAEVKGIPLGKVIRNASRDYAQAAQKATPVAKTGTSEYYVATRNGRRWYVHQSQIRGRIANREGGTQLRKVRIHRGWSKATWIGAMRALGMSSKQPARRLPSAVEHKAYAIQRTAGENPSVTISDEFRIDGFGRTTTLAQHTRIAGEGFRLAAKRISTEYVRLLKEAWTR